jgi:DNA adenine methylase
MQGRAQSSPLRWAGSKKRLLKRLISHVPAGYFRYVEPFAGSAVLFYALTPREALLSDINSDLICFYRHLRRYPAELFTLASSYERNRSTFELTRRSHQQLHGIDRAASFWYLNSCCFNGLYRTNRAGHFNVPFGSKLPPFPSWDEASVWSRILQSADILDADFATTMAKTTETDFVYLDPPYARTGFRNRGEYGPNALQPDEIDFVLSSARSASERGVRILFSYNRDLSELLPDWFSEVINVRRDIAASASSRATVNEYLFWNYKLRMGEK